MVQEPLNPAVLESARQLLDRTKLRWTDALQLGAALVAREMFRGTEIILFGFAGVDGSRPSGGIPGARSSQRKTACERLFRTYGPARWSTGWSLFATETIGLFEFVAQFGRAQVFADVGEALFESLERGCDGIGVGMGDVAPHGKGAGAETRHLAQSAAADIFQFRSIADFVFEQRAQGGGDELRQMADPGDEFVVAGGVKVDDFGAHGDDPLAPAQDEFCAARCADCTRARR